MTDLAAWLLARIAEDEEHARHARPQDGDPEEQDYDRESWHEARCGYGMGEYMLDCLCGVPARVLAECDAKRRIVEGYTDLDDAPDRHEQVQSLRWACQLLALCYADQPGYRDEWRP